MIQQEIDKLQKLKTPAEAPKALQPLKEQIAIEDVRKVDLRVAKIIHAERVPKSKKLLKLTVDIGLEQRTIVAGIGEKMEDINALIGRKIVVVANLKPATLMGVESQGMVLAADGPIGLELLSITEALPGSPVA